MKKVPKELLEAVIKAKKEAECTIATFEEGVRVEEKTRELKKAKAENKNLTSLKFESVIKELEDKIYILEKELEEVTHT